MRIKDDLDEELALAPLDDQPAASSISRRSALPAESAAIRARAGTVGGATRANPADDMSRKRAAESSLLDEALEELASMESSASSLPQLPPAVRASIQRAQPARRRPRPGDDDEVVRPLWFLMLVGAFLAGLLIMVGFSCIKSFTPPPAPDKVHLD
jgi:hypothetical protein